MVNVDTKDENINMEIFFAVRKGVNVVTPDIISYERKGDYVIEVSKGRFLDSYLFGVTVVNAITRVAEWDKDKCFSARTEREAYLEAMEYVNSFGK